MPAQLADDRGHRIGGEVRATLLTEAVDSLDQSDRPDLDEIVDRLRRPREPTSKGVDERKVLLDHASAGASVSSTMVRREERRRGPPPTVVRHPAITTWIHPSMQHNIQRYRRRVQGQFLQGDE
jgi:hypothetical protein